MRRGKLLSELSSFCCEYGLEGLEQTTVDEGKLMGRKEGNRKSSRIISSV
jgi:hypothetical protein